MSEETTTGRGPGAWWRQVLIVALPLALAWAAAFWVTGILWWHAPQGAEQPLEPPAAAQVHAADTSWVNLDLYRRSNPQWRP